MGAATAAAVCLKELYCHVLGVALDQGVQRTLSLMLHVDIIAAEQNAGTPEFHTRGNQAPVRSWR